MPYGNKPKSMGLKKLAQANPDKLKYVGPAKYAPKKMGCSGGGPNMYKMGSKEKNTPMNFSDKAMMYMKNMPAMYGKPKMDGDPVKNKEAKTAIGGAYEKLKADNKLTPQGDSYYKEHKETPGQFAKRKKEDYNRKFGEGSAQKRYKNTPAGRVATYLGKDKLSGTDYKKYIDPKTGKVKAPKTFASSAEAKKFFTAIGKTKK